MLIRTVNRKYGISHEVEETVTTNFLQFAPEDVLDNHSDDMITIDCNYIRTGIFETENKEPLALCVDTGAPKSVIDKKQMKCILDMLNLKCMLAIRSSHVFCFDDVSAKK